MWHCATGESGESRRGPDNRSLRKLEDKDDGCWGRAKKAEKGESALKGQGVQ